MQAHVSEDLPFKYIFSAFWEGQEGSFLLWMFWHIVLGMILLVNGKKWEAPVLSILALIQAFIGSMILGIYVGFGEEMVKIGSNPLLLLRETVDAPIFSNADYVSLIKGTGINPLLQNYWMTIHPPTLFLGFASTAIPFCFAIAGLWTGQFKEWLKPALPWALFSGSILGLGILMGGAWAYEALSFGGYWAWDPVENMSLVPWLILVAGIHTNLIARNTGHALKSTFIYYLLTFLFIVYSTFLTRSGVLGETSVHAFTQMGLEWQLIIFIGAFLLLSTVLFLVKNRQIPAQKKDESTASREFWMFIGSLILLFSALIITASTSLPVYNKIMQFFDPNFEGKVITDPIPHYNKYQIWIAIFIGFLSGVTQFLRYRAVNWSNRASKFFIRTGVLAGTSALISFLITKWIDTQSWQYAVLLFAGVFTVVANTDYLVAFLKGNLKVGASSIAHIGFGLMLVGIIASGLNHRVVSSYPFLMEGIISDNTTEEMARKNIMLFKGTSMPMNRYEVTYVGDTIDKFNRTYTVNFKRRNSSGKVVEDFNLYPNVLYNKAFTNIDVPNPSTRRYWDKDMFTVISALPESEMNFELRQQKEDSLEYELLELEQGQLASFNDTVPLRDRDAVSVRRFQFELVDINRNPTHPDYEPEPGDLALSAILRMRGKNIDSIFTVEPVLVLRGRLLYSYPVQIDELEAKVKLDEKIIERVFTFEEDLDYLQFSVRQGETFSYEGLQFTLQQFNKNPQHSSYQPQEGDISVGALLRIEAPDGRGYTAQPIYFIRGNRPLNVKDEVPPLGLHLRFSSLNPQTESMELWVARSTKNEQLKIPIAFAPFSPRTDWLVLQAIEFPGINFFWFGSLLMIFGLGLGMVHRLRKNA